MIPKGRPPTNDEMMKVFKYIQDNSDLITGYLSRLGLEITSNDILRCIINDIKKD